MSGEPAFLIAAVRRFLNPEAPLPHPETIDWTVLLRLADLMEGETALRGGRLGELLAHDAENRTDYASTLEAYNTGAIGPGHCSEDRTTSKTP